ncbi:hypothetical protein WA026_002491 [Henosepilachna vigintioctopunctata]|uniref:Uncharacterized protein n=1 Tax=Henosepilachna vigintioctopunctata TaxID=420089 RepID=A0AAW1TRI5_9CUCU
MAMTNAWHLHKYREGFPIYPYEIDSFTFNKLLLPLSPQISQPKGMPAYPAPKLTAVETATERSVERAPNKTIEPNKEQ